MPDKTAVLLSIRPEWVRLILRGEKTLEIRRNRPKLELPFRCYIYSTLPDGRVVAEFMCDEIRRYPMPQSKEDSAALRDFWQCALLKTAVLCEYSGFWTHDLYGWHISALTVYDKPLNLSEFTRLDGSPVKHPPQSWGYVREIPPSS